ncbi:MAG: hypothetical protein KAJ62_01450 [Desulfobacteraceae bacterium]|nr:hypothetical protein [Desulfobacteraceae bacterium]
MTKKKIIFAVSSASYAVHQNRAVLMDIAARNQWNFSKGYCGSCFNTNRKKYILWAKQPLVNKNQVIVATKHAIRNHRPRNYDHIIITVGCRVTNLNKYSNETIIYRCVPDVNEYLM